MIDLGIAQHFLFESFQIEFGVSIRKRIKGASPEEKIGLNNIITLRNLFLTRIDVDPGFYQYLLENILRDNVLMTELKVKIIQLCSGGVWGESLDLGEYGMARVGRPIDGDADIDDHSDKLFEEYFDRFDELAREQGDEDLMVALDWLNAGRSSHKPENSWLFFPEEFYLGGAETKAWDYQSINFVMTNIKWPEIYSRRIFVLSVVRKNLAQRLVLERRLMDILKEISGGDFPRDDEWHRFTEDALAIAMLIWFDRSSIEQKKEMLNREYEFSPRIDDNVLREMERDSAMFATVADKLISEGYIDEAIWSFNALLNLSSDTFASYHYHYRLGQLHEELGDHLQALAKFQAALEDASILDEHRDILVAIANIKLGENYLITGDKGRGMYHLMLAEESQESSPPDERKFFFWTMAEAYRELADYDKELRYLAKVLKIESEQYLTIAAENRLATLSDSSFYLPNGKLNHAALADNEKEGKARTFSDRATRAHNAFQFKAQRKWLERAISIEPKVECRYCLAELDYLEGNYDTALTSVQELEREDPTTSQITLLRANILVSKGCIDEAIGLLKSELSSVVPKDLERVLGLIISDPAILTIIIGMVELVDALSSVFSEGDERGYYLAIMAHQLHMLGFPKESLLVLNKAIKCSSSKDLKLLALSERGFVLLEWGMVDKAHDNFCKMFEIEPANTTAFYGIALCQASVRDFTNALRTLEVASRGTNDPRVKQMMERMGLLMEQVINVPLVKDEEVRKALKTGDNHVLNPRVVAGMGASSDYSGAFVQYGKALQMMLDREISRRLRTVVREAFNGHIDDVYWYGTHGIAPLPLGLVRILEMDSRPLTIGDWKYLINDLNRETNNPVTILARNKLDALLGNRARKIVLMACSILKELRNPSAHTAVMTHKQVVERRKEVVFFLNLVIDYLYLQLPMMEANPGAKSLFEKERSSSS